VKLHRKIDPRWSSEMTAEIQVLSGPDNGKICQLVQSSARIGVGATMEFPLTDMQLRGCLVVDFRNGVYHVRNELEGAIYLDKEVLQPGDSRVWFDEQILQPTAATRMRLRHTDQRADSQSGRATVVLVPNQNASSQMTLTAAIATICILAGLLILGNSNTTVTQIQSVEFGRLPALADIVQKKLLESRVWAETRGLLPLWDRTFEQFQKARLADRLGDRDTAKKRYEFCSRLLQQLKDHPDYHSSGMNSWVNDKGRTQTNDALEYFLNQRLIDLSR
jgi:hypothetical protein